MGASKRLKSTLLLIAEHRQAKVCDSSVLQGDGEVAAISRQSGSSRKGRHWKLVLRPLVKLKDAFVELVVSAGGTPPGRSSAAYCSMGVVMGPVDFGAYAAVSSSLALSNQCTKHLRDERL